MAQQDSRHHLPGLLGPAGLAEALERINKEASQAIADGYKPRRAERPGQWGTDRIAMSALLAVGTCPSFLVQSKAERSQDRA